jgi:hypothetical protein
MPLSTMLYSIHYLIKLDSDLQQVGGFFPVSSSNKTDGHDRTVILLKVALNIISPNPIFSFSLYADDRILFQNLKALWQGASIAP